jgi:hypothetical protein
MRGVARLSRRATLWAVFAIAALLMTPGSLSVGSTSHEPSPMASGVSSDSEFLSELGPSTSPLESSTIACPTLHGCLPADLAPASTSDSWVNITTINPVNPPRLTYSSMAYGAGFILLFGGLDFDGKATNYTWEFQDFAWTNYTSYFPVAPSPRYYAALTFDPQVNAFVLFGGANGGSRALGDTWLFSNNYGWTRWTPTGGYVPAGRFGAEFAYDPTDEYTVLFGGTDSVNDYNDTWAFTPSNWTELTPTVSPEERENAIFVWDAEDGYLFMSGGTNNPCCMADTDDWAFVDGNWSSISSSPKPLDRFLSAAAYDPSIRSVLEFGGFNPESCGNLADTWSYNDSTWTQVSVAGPGARAGQSMAFDTYNGFAVLFGGENYPGCYGGGALNDTWVFGPWTQPTVGPLAITALANPYLAPAGARVNFSAYALGGIQPYSFQWSFDDGNFSSTPVSTYYSNTSSVFNTSGNYAVTVTAYDSAKHSATEVIPVSIGSVMVLNWLPPRDTYSFDNYGSYWSAGGNCYGISSSEILYWEHDIEGWGTAPDLPLSASATSALNAPSNIATGLNAVTLAIMAHQVYDPNNNIFGSPYGSGGFANSWATALSYLKAGQPIQVSLGSNDRHSVVLYGEQTFSNGTTEWDISDPNSPLVTTHAWYDPIAKSFVYANLAVWHGFTLDGGGAPLPLQSNWLVPDVFLHDVSWTDFPPNTSGDEFVASNEPIEVTAAAETDSFTTPGDSQTFVGNIPDSVGIEEASDQLYEMPLPEVGPGLVIADAPSAETDLQAFRDVGSGPTLTVNGYAVSLNSTLPHTFSIESRADGFTLSVGAYAVTANVSFVQMVGNASDTLYATALDFESGSTENFTISNWAGLSSTTVAALNVTVTPAGASAPNGTYGIVNGQVGLVATPPASPPAATPPSSAPFYVGGDFFIGLGLVAVAIASVAIVLIFRKGGKLPPIPR